MANELNRDTYLSKNVGDFASEIIMDGRRYVKVDDRVTAPIPTSRRLSTSPLRKNLWSSEI